MVEPPVEDCYKKLANDLIIKGVDDLHRKDILRSFEALCWWLGGDPAIMLEGVGLVIMPDDALLCALEGRQAKNVRTKKNESSGI